jgi:Protein of unknown function (DUF3501)
MAMKHALTPQDILPPAEYAKVRKERRAAAVARKKDRRIEVGPVATFHFENFDSMWLQVQEMLYIEKGGEAQIEDELQAYNPLIPQGSELIATVMFEIDDPHRRKAFLSRLGGIEETAFIRIDDETVRGVPETDVDRTTGDGKASSVQFIHFPFTRVQIAKFRRPNAQIIVGFTHPAYGHMVIMPEAVRLALAEDFD